MAFAFLGLPIVMSIAFFVICCLIIWGIAKFMLYIFQSFGLLNIAKKEQYKFPYIAWIPGLSHYILGKFCMDNTKGIIYSILTIIKLVLFIIVIFIDNTILFNTFLIYVIIYFIIDMLVMDKFYKKVYNNPQVFTIFTIITFGILKPIFIYTIRIPKISKYNIVEKK